MPVPTPISPLRLVCPREPLGEGGPPPWRSFPGVPGAWPSRAWLTVARCGEEGPGAEKAEPWEMLTPDRGSGVREYRQGLTF